MIAIIDYGAGNTASVINVLKDLKADFVLSGDKEIISSADKIILPGVGEASSAMNILNELYLIDVIKNFSKPFLGICLGMQLLCRKTEEGDADCLNIIPVDVKKFNLQKTKVPHMGWNQIELVNNNFLFNGIDDKSYFYFAHSYYVAENEFTTSVCKYGINFSSSIRYENFYGVQFHPEKSAEQGIQIIKNFLSL
ncbi:MULTISPECIES: imidazole glycerol phosphate synthase subunit HisH [Ignavibacterium]|jgi:glutamine amidotransferase|uniref:imidazole glycerol phosphate synthase subunit HisH n=1 Tax=Ignavibacterium TaxID=795750 RepID=UPI0025B905E3|nr:MULTISPECIES: imidazole glycerol phosphate synthase subunit HisH [Ignavibacterium]MBI5662301.1 imidazole glycerol phosphate synthase subunit HisH [Ignavibacterium album]